MAINEIEQFWSMINSDDPEIQMEGSLNWVEFMKKHPKYFESIKSNFSKQFCDIYQNIRFHDFHIHKMSCFSADLSKHTKIELLLFDYHEDYDKDLYFNLVYHDVKEYTLNVKPTDFYLTWDSDIFEIRDDGIIRHRIACNNGTYIEITFKGISIHEHRERHEYVAP